MSKKFTRTYTYDASVDAVWAMMTDQSYWDAKYSALGATEVQWNQFEASDDSFTYTSVRNVPADLPSVAKKIIGDTNTVTTTERWTRAGDSASATIEIHVKNVPGGTTGTMEVGASGDSATWSFDFDTKVGLPMVGGKLEGIMNDQTGEQLGQEKTFNDQWLADNA
jgi:hypothetical protein